MSTKIARITRKTFSEAVAEAAKEVPGAGAVLAVLGGVIRARTEVKFRAFLEALGKPLAFDNWEGVVGHITEHIEEPWMVDGLEEGWRTAQDALDPVAKRCVYAMVADYMAQEKLPDRLHRQIGNLLIETDERALRVIRKISTAHKFVGQTYAFVSKSVARGQEEQRKRFFYEVQNGKDKCVLLPGVEEDEALQDACDLLIRAGFMSTWFSHMQMNHTHEEFGVCSVYGQIKHHQAESWSSLHKYLTPIDGL